MAYRLLDFFLFINLFAFFAKARKEEARFLGFCFFAVLFEVFFFLTTSFFLLFVIFFLRGFPFFFCDFPVLDFFTNFSLGGGGGASICSTSGLSLSVVLGWDS